MSAETKGYLIRVTFSQDGTLVVYGKSKKPFGRELPDKINTTTDETEDYQEFEPGFLPEIIDGTLVVAHDFDQEQKFADIIGEKGTITFTSLASGKNVAYANSWVKSYDPQEAGHNDQPEANLTFESGGGTAGVPVVSANP